MSNLAWPPIRTDARRLAKWTRIRWLGLAVMALMALSFAVGRATVDHTGPLTPSSNQSAVQPAGSPTGDGQLGCRLHARC